MLNIAARNSQRLAALVEDLLDLQKLEADEMEFFYKPINANDLVQEAVESTEGYASKLDINVAVQLCTKACQISGDSKRLIQVLSNLLSNAYKFSDEGSKVDVTVQVLGEHVRISVQDHGAGIPRGLREAVFGKFTQVDASDIRKVGGTGLGLNISKHILDRHNAKIDYVSEVGVGTTFFIDFNRIKDVKAMPVDSKQITQAA